MTKPKIDAVIPVLGCPSGLGATLASLQEGRNAGLLRAVFLVSGDGDPALAASHGDAARIVASEPGRGRQLATGAAASKAGWLLFLHADTCLAPGWVAEVATFLTNPAVGGQAAAFRLAFDDQSPAARRVAALANWRSRFFGLPYGDQGLLISRTFYESLGGFRPLALMEDVDLVRRIGKRRLVLLKSAAVTSAARYRRDGWWLRPLRNLSILALYFLRVPPAILRWLYR